MMKIKSRDSEMKLGHDSFAQTKDSQRTKRNKKRTWSNQRAAVALFFIHA
jgi:hypothetical protein